MDKKKIMICSIIFLLVVIVVCSVALQSAKQDLEDSEKQLQQTLEKYGYVEEEKVNVVVAKFNTEIMDSGLNTPVYLDSMVMENELYWYAVTEEISMYIQPLEFTEDSEQDIAKLISLYIDKEDYNEETAIKYAKKLIKANNNEFTEEKINKLIEEAKAVSNKPEMVNSGKGINFAILETDNHYEYQVKRIYK